MTMAHSSTLDEILSAMDIDVEHANISPISHEDVMRWMQTDDVEALGALYELLTESRYYSRVKPQLDFNEYFTFMKEYYERCFLENPDGDWSDSRYSAGWSLAAWFKGLWNDPKVPRSALAELKSWLAGLYKAGDQDLRTCLITATLEHLFENREIARYFSDWKKDDVLNAAYNNAMEWNAKQPG